MTHQEDIALVYLARWGTLYKTGFGSWWLSAGDPRLLGSTSHAMLRKLRRPLVQISGPWIWTLSRDPWFPCVMSRWVRNIYL